MLGVLEMDVQTCIDRYLAMAPKIFPKEGFVSGSKVGRFFKGMKGDARFNEVALEECIKTLVVVKFGNLGADTALGNKSAGSDSPGCRT